MFSLNDKSKAVLRNSLSEVKYLVIVEFSTVSSDLWTDISLSLVEILMMIPGKSFAGLSIMTVSDFLQLPQVKGKFVFFGIE